MELGTFGVELETFRAVEVERRGGVKRRDVAEHRRDFAAEGRNGAKRSGVPELQNPSCAERSPGASRSLGATPEQAKRRTRHDKRPQLHAKRRKLQTEGDNITQISGLAFFRALGVVERASGVARTGELKDGAMAFFRDTTSNFVKDGAIPPRIS